MRNLSPGPGLPSGHDTCYNTIISSSCHLGPRQWVFRPHGKLRTRDSRPPPIPHLKHFRLRGSTPAAGAPLQVWPINAICRTAPQPTPSHGRLIAFPHMVALLRSPQCRLIAFPSWSLNCVPQMVALLRSPHGRSSAFPTMSLNCVPLWLLYCVPHARSIAFLTWSL